MVSIIVLNHKAMYKQTPHRETVKYREYVLEPDGSFGVDSDAISPQKNQFPHNEDVEEEDYHSQNVLQSRYCTHSMSQIPKTPGSISIIHRYDTKMSYRCILDIGPKVFVGIVIIASKTFVGCYAVSTISFMFEQEQDDL